MKTEEVVHICLFTCVQQLKTCVHVRIHFTVGKTLRLRTMQSADCILSPMQSADCAGSQIACNRDISTLAKTVSQVTQVRESEHQLPVQGITFKINRPLLLIMMLARTSFDTFHSFIM